LFLFQRRSLSTHIFFVFFAALAAYLVGLARALLLRGEGRDG
jgi:hypothetical protein